MRTILILTLLAVTQAFGQAPPVQRNPFTTNDPPNTITNTVPLVQSNASLSVIGTGPLTNEWGGASTVQDIKGLVLTTNWINGALNVRSFGAVGDGITDDQIALQYALNTVASTNGEVYLGAGTYNLTGSVTITNSCRIRGDGARIIVPDASPAFVLNKFTNGIIQGLEFVNYNTTGDPAVAIYGQTNNLSGMRIIGNTFTRCKVIPRDDDIFDSVQNNFNLTITGNTWRGNYGMAVFIGDVANCLDVRGWDGLVIADNIFEVTNEERFIHISECVNFTITGNIFNSAGSTIATQCIDIFADCKRATISNNIFTLTNSTVSAIIYGKTTGPGPSGDINSQHTALNVSDNTITVTTSDANWQGIALYGPWGMPDQAIDEATAIVNGNQIDVRTTSSAPHIELRGFSAANIADNILSGTNTTAGFKRTISADNNKVVNITGNLLTYGRISVNGAASTPQSTNYILSPLSVTIANNQIQSFKNLGGIWITACTNLGDLLISNNRITTAESSSADGLIYMDNCPGSTNVIITGTTGYSDNGNYFVKANTTTVQGEVVTGNFWQSQGIVTSVPPTNSIVTIDFRGEEFQTTYYLNDSTNTTLTFGVTNCLFGRSVIYRLQVGETNRTLAYDPTWVIAQGTPVNVESNRTVVLRFTSWSTNCGSANVTVEPWMQREDVNPLVFNTLNVERLSSSDEATVVELDSSQAFGSILSFMHNSVTRSGLAWHAASNTLGFVDGTLGVRNFSVDTNGNTITRTSAISPIVKSMEGSGTDGAGTSLVIQGGSGTGTGKGGNITVQTADTEATGATLNPYITRQYFYADHKDLTAGVATTIATIALPDGDNLAVEVFALTSAGEGTERQSVADSFLVAASNESGVITVNLSTPVSVAGNSTGTLTPTWSVVQNGAAIDIKNSAVSSLTETFLRCRWQLHINSSDVATVTPNP